jgi:hypothetical protein
MGVVVDEVEGINERCPFRFTVEFFDTFSSLPRTIESMTNLKNRPDPLPKPCAVLGAFRSAVSTPLSILTGVYGLPQLSPVSSSPGLDNTNLHPLFSRLVPSDAGTSELTVKYLQDLGVQHVGVINVDDAYGSAYRQAFQRIAEAAGMRVEAVSFPFKPTPKQIQFAISQLKKSGYRYFFGIIFGPEHYEMVMTEAYRQGIAGNFDAPTFWIYGGGVQRFLQNVRYEPGSPLALATQGAACIQADGGIEGMPGFDRYLQAWKNMSTESIDFFNSKQPLPHDYYYTADYDYFKRNDPERESIFAYDAAIALGLSACSLLEKKKTTDGEYFAGQEHFDEFVATTFEGASGQVIIDTQVTSRKPSSALYVIFNAVANDPDNDNLISYAVEPTVVHRSAGDGWQTYKDERPFVFNNNSTEPPPALPYLSIQKNYIGPAFRGAVIALSVLGILSSVFFGVWTLQNTSNRIVKASQPIFLVLICIGSLFMSASIIPLSIDDEIASPRACSISCMLVPWLYTTGFALVFAALYSKTKRVTMLLNQRSLRRVKVEAKDVMLPLIGLLFANILVLTLWTAISPLKWTREFTGTVDVFDREVESFGGCLVGADRSFVPYIVTLLVINAAVLLFANLQAFRAREIHTEFSESKFIGMGMASMLQSWIIGIPLLFVVYGDAQAQLLVLSCVIFAGAMAILYLIMGPKWLLRNKKHRLRKRQMGSVSGLEFTNDADEDNDRPTGRVRVSGVNLSLVGGSERSISDQDDKTSYGNGSISSSGGEGIKVYQNEAERKNALLEINLDAVKRERDDLYREMQRLLKDAEKTDEENGAVVKINSKVLERSLRRYSAPDEEDEGNN